MKSKTLRTGIFAGLIGVVFAAPAVAELPSLEVKPWFGYFAGVQGKRADIGFDTDGGAVIIPLGKNREQMSTNSFIKIEYVVEETLPDGKVAVKKIDPDSLESTSPATAKPGNIVVKGKVDGDATFELYFENVRGSVMLGGKVLQPGTVKNPLKLSVRIAFPKVYAKPDADEKVFKKKIEDDQISVRHVDGKKVKVGVEDVFDPASPEFNGLGINQAEVEISEFPESKFIFTAAPGSKLTVKNTKGAPFYDGLALVWEADSATDPQGRARLAIEVK